MSSQTKTQTLWGILGTARIAEKVVRAMHNAPAAEPLAIASRDEGRAQQWAAAHGLKRAYGGYDRLLDDEDIDAVYIPLPPSMHEEWTIKAAEKGKHVLCEKPLALNSGQARAMVDACRENGVQLMDGVMWVHHLRTASMKRVIDGGQLGAQRRVTAAFTFNWDVIPEDNIRVKSELGGGALGDLGYYCVRAILWAFDELPISVYAAARFAHGVDFSLSGLLWFTGDRVASFDCGFDAVLRRRFEVAGTQAALVCEDFVVPAGEDRSEYRIFGKPREDERHEVAACIQEVQMVETFSRIVQSGRLEERWPLAALDTTRVCDALIESARDGQRIALKRASRAGESA